MAEQVPDLPVIEFGSAKAWNTWLAKHHTSSGPDSAGLGLYIARGLIELHGGLITVDSQPDVFTEFTVLLPFKQSVRRDSEPPVR